MYVCMGVCVFACMPVCLFVDALHNAFEYLAAVSFCRYYPTSDHLQILFSDCIVKDELTFLARKTYGCDRIYRENSETSVEEV